VLAFNQRAGVTLTAQVGMSGTLTAITDLAGEVRWIEQVHLDVAEGADAMAAMLQRQFEAGLAAVDIGKRVYGIGIGLPGDIEIAARAGGAARPWDPAVITARLSKQFGCPVFTDGDVNYLALGEQRSTWSRSSTLLWCATPGRRSARWRRP
jgi:predicted NBD/HSP70 family sugar kinase